MAKTPLPKASAKKRKKGPSKSYNKFEVLVQRSLNLLALQPAMDSFLAQSGTTKEDVDSDDIARAAIVLAVAAMDSYFTDIFTELLVPFLKKKGPTKDMIVLLGEAGLNTEVALEMIKLNRPYRRVRSLVENYFGKYTTQKMDVIDELFKCYSIKDLTLNAQKKTGKKSLRSSLNKLIERRHCIVHEGDRNSRGKCNSINKSSVKRWIKLMTEFVSAADQILANIR